MMIAVHTNFYEEQTGVKIDIVVGRLKEKRPMKLENLGFVQNQCHLSLSYFRFYQTNIEVY